MLAGACLGDAKGLSKGAGLPFATARAPFRPEWFGCRQFQSINWNLSLVLVICTCSRRLPTLERRAGLGWGLGASGQQFLFSSFADSCQ